MSLLKTLFGYDKPAEPREHTCRLYKHHVLEIPDTSCGTCGRELVRYDNCDCCGIERALTACPSEMWPEMYWLCYDCETE